jgi:hypothetical protein
MQPFNQLQIQQQAFLFCLFTQVQVITQNQPQLKQLKLLLLVAEERAEQEELPLRLAAQRLSVVVAAAAAALPHLFIQRLLYPQAQSLTP